MMKFYFSYKNIAFFVVLSFAFYNILHAHEIKFKVPHKGKTKEVTVKHRHVCDQKIVERRIDRNAAFARIVLIHRIELPRSVVVMWETVMETWSKLKGFKFKKKSGPTNYWNCHGLVFDDGKSWIDDPEEYLKNCKEIKHKDAKPGDVVIYINKKNQITHSGKVTSIDKKGKIMVHSKFGSMGGYEHGINEVPQGEQVVYDSPSGKKVPITMATYGRTKIYRCN